MLLRFLRGFDLVSAWESKNATVCYDLGVFESLANSDSFTESASVPGYDFRYGDLFYKSPLPPSSEASTDVNIGIREDAENKPPPRAALRDLPVPIPSPPHLQGAIPFLPPPPPLSPVPSPSRRPPHIHRLGSSAPVGSPAPVGPSPSGRHNFKRRLREKRQRRTEWQEGRGEASGGVVNNRGVINVMMGDIHVSGGVCNIHK